jgi:hypothetical protein
MKFFIPNAKDDEQRDSIYSAIIKFAEEQTGWKVKSRKIYRIFYKHNGQRYENKVGEPEKINGVTMGETVFAILESSVTFFVCTPNRCVLRGFPILVGREEIMEIEDFET